MSDEELAALERAARERGDATALRYARALERLGRSESEIVAALCLGRADLEVRRALAARDGDTLPRTVRERWTTTLPAREYFTLAHATPLGIVCVSTARILVLDPDTGEERFRKDDGLAFVEGTTLLVLRDFLMGYDLWTGEELWRKRLSTRSAVSGHGLFLVLEENEVLVHRFSEERKAPELAWRVDGRTAIAGPRLVVVTVEPNVFAAHDASTGKELWRAEGNGFCSDERGVLAIGRGQALVAYGLEGRPVWTRSGRFMAHVAPRKDGAIVAHEWPVPPREPVLLDRATGEPVRDDRLFLIESDSELRAQSGRGTIAWTWKGATTLSARSAAGRVYVGVGRRSVTCLEDA